MPPHKVLLNHVHVEEHDTDILGLLCGMGERCSTFAKDPKEMQCITMDVCLHVITQFCLALLAVEDLHEYGATV